MHFSWSVYRWPVVTVTPVHGESIWVSREQRKTSALAVEARTYHRSHSSYSSEFFDRNLTHFKICSFPCVGFQTTYFIISKQQEYRGLCGSFVSKSASCSVPLFDRPPTRRFWLVCVAVLISFYFRTLIFVPWGRRGMCGLKWSTALLHKWSWIHSIYK